MDKGVSLMPVFKQFFYSQDDKRRLCITQSDHGELCVLTPDMSSRDEQPSDDTDF